MSGIVCLLLIVGFWCFFCYLLHLLVKHSTKD